MTSAHAREPASRRRTAFAVAIVFALLCTRPIGTPAQAAAPAAGTPRAFAEAVEAARSNSGPEVFRQAVADLPEGKCLPPISFRLGDQTQAGMLARAQRAQATRSVPAGSVRDITYLDPATGLSCRIELTEYRDFPAVEWVAHFMNTGTKALPVLTDVAALDFTWRCDGDAFLFRAPGAAETPYDFQFQREPLQTIRAKRANLTMRAGNEGRPSVDWLPFFHLQSWGGEGLFVASGWTGQW